MSREIKFRAWHPNYGMANHVAVYSDGDWGADWWHPLESSGEKDGAVLMQYTGLKDANGREVFEGDIVKYEDEYGKSIYVIEWHDEQARFYLASEDDPEYNELMDMVNPLEVIGNIYENPELMEAR